MAGATWNCCRLGASSVYAIQPRTSLHCHFIRSHMRRMHVCLAVTCHLHFWQNVRFFKVFFFFTCYCGNIGVERIPNKIQHRKLTMEKKILPSLLPGLEPEIFQSRVRRFATEPSPLPDWNCHCIVNSGSDRSLPLTLKINVQRSNVHSLWPLWNV